MAGVSSVGAGEAGSVIGEGEGEEEGSAMGRGNLI